MEIIQKLATGGAKEGDVNALEQRLSKPLPESYRRFLLELNGGRPQPSEFEFEQYGKPQGSVVDWFFTLNKEKPTYYTVDKMEIYSNRIPSDLLPIAFDPFGNLILLDLGAKSVGAIYFWDHEKENCEGDPWWDNISYIAPSFTEFVTSLH